MNLKKTRIPILLSFILICLSSTLIKAAEIHEISKSQSYEIDSEQKFEQLALQYQQFKKQTSPSLIRSFEQRGKPIMALTRAQRKLKAEYLDLKQSVWFWGKVSQLKKDLLNSYLKQYPDTSETDRDSMENEANKLAFQVIQNIERLQKEYKIHTFPIVHNLFLDLKLAKRGACKHWAEDLLKVINAVEHPHFTSYWAEIHPGKITEHNVAVIAPKGVPFDEGIVIDPWRTAGEPFWIPVKDDSHPWQQWTGYAPQ